MLHSEKTFIKRFLFTLCAQLFIGVYIIGMSGLALFFIIYGMTNDKMHYGVYSLTVSVFFGVSMNVGANFYEKIKSGDY